MTTQATGDEPNPAAEEPRPAAEEPRPGGTLEPALQPAPAADPAAAARAGLVLPRGRPPRRATALHRPYPRLDPDLARPPRPATIDALAKGLDVRGLGGPRRRRRVHRATTTTTRPRRRKPGDPERELLIASIDD